MSNDTKGFVVTPCKDVLIFAAIIEKLLTRFILDEAKLQFPKCRGMIMPPEARERFELPTPELRADSDLVQFHFKFDGQQRILWLHLGGDEERKEFGPQSISLSMGDWGCSDTIMRLVLYALSFSGPAYINVVAGLGDAEYEPLPESRPAYLDLLALRYVSHLSLKKFISLWDSSSRPSGLSALEYFGTDEATVREWLARENFTSAWDEMTVVAKSRKVVVTALNDFHEAMCA